MVYGRLVEGSAKEIAETLTKLVGDRRVKVMLMDETARPASEYARISDAEFEIEMAAIRAAAVSVSHVDDSREALYTRQEGE